MKEYLVKQRDERVQRDCRGFLWVPAIHKEKLLHGHAAVISHLITRHVKLQCCAKRLEEGTHKHLG